MKHIQQAILKTLCYADIFDYPLTEGELWRYLIINKKISLLLFRKALIVLEKEQRILHQKTYFTLPNRHKLIRLRQIRSHVAQQKMCFAKEQVFWLRFIPTIWFIGISGALSMENAPKEDDIDFFIITAPGTLWLTRFLATLTLDIQGTRRKPNAITYRNKICLNMFIDATRLKLSQTEQDIYSAHEIVQLKPVLNRHRTFERFLCSNAWIKKWLPHALILPNRVKPIFPALWIQLLSPLEKITKIFQLKYMQSRRTTEKINACQLRFHPHDARGWIKNKYQQKLNNLKLKI